MTTYTIEMHRTPGLSDDERQRRLSEAFDVLFNLKKTSAAQDNYDDKSGPAANAPDDRANLASLRLPSEELPEFRNEG